MDRGHNKFEHPIWARNVQAVRRNMFRRTFGRAGRGVKAVPIHRHAMNAAVKEALKAGPSKRLSERTAANTCYTPLT